MIGLNHETQPSLGTERKRQNKEQIAMTSRECSDGTPLVFRYMEFIHSPILNMGSTSFFIGFFLPPEVYKSHI